MPNAVVPAAVPIRPVPAVLAPALVGVVLAAEAVAVRPAVEVVARHLLRVCVRAGQGMGKEWAAKWEKNS